MFLRRQARHSRSPSHAFDRPQFALRQDRGSFRAGQRSEAERRRLRLLQSRSSMAAIRRAPVLARSRRASLPLEHRGRPAGREPTSVADAMENWLHIGTAQASAHGNQFRRVASANATCSRRATKPVIETAAPPPRASPTPLLRTPRFFPQSRSNPLRSTPVLAAGLPVAKPTAPATTPPRFNPSYHQLGVHCNHAAQVAHVCAGPDARGQTRERTGHA